MGNHSIKIFGIGDNKTGTSTLGACYDILHIGPQIAWRPGFSSSWNGHKLEFNDALEASKEYISFQDFPWNYMGFYQKFDKAYPDSKFILTVRDQEKWFVSFVRWCTQDGKEDILGRIKKRFKAHPDIIENFRGILKEKYGIGEGPVSPFKSTIIKAFNNRNAEIIEYFKDRPDGLLIVDWATGDEWKKLCRFLNRPIPNCPFPHKNKQ